MDKSRIAAACYCLLLNSASSGSTLTSQEHAMSRNLAHLPQGFNQIYDWNLANSLRRIYNKHENLWRGVGGRFRPDLVAQAKTIYDFDDYITIHSFGKSHWSTHG